MASPSGALLGCVLPFPGDIRNGAANAAFKRLTRRDDRDGTGGCLDLTLMAIFYHFGVSEHTSVEEASLLPSGRFL
jgi:hypothetical protein